MTLKTSKPASNSFMFNFHSHRTGALKVIKTISSVFIFRKVYLKYVIVYQRGIRPQPIAMEQIYFNIYFHKTRALLELLKLSLVFSYFVRLTPVCRGVNAEIAGI